MARKGHHLAIWGIVLQLGAIIVGIITVVGMSRVMSAMRQIEPVSIDTITADMSAALCVGLAGGLAALLGMGFILVALFPMHYRASWFRRALWTLSILWLFSGPVGIVVGIVIMVYLVNHKNEFTEPAAAR